jgi:hypothetical protein
MYRGVITLLFTLNLCLKFLTFYFHIYKVILIYNSLFIRVYVTKAGILCDQIISN